ncbi:MAG: peroxiredoxin [Candidatus Gastranaerophilales bacterium]|nr:peroxiredoxin [Candidatus Gastranaerophilales bacterium]
MDNDTFTPINHISLGDPAPDFVATTTHGEIQFHDYIRNSWAILFSHPADFTPVCTTEFLGFAEKQEEFDKRGVKLIGLSIDSVYSHIAWIKAMKEHFDVEVKFPVIADVGAEVAKKYSMIHPKISTTQAVRTVVIINPTGEVAFIVTYPMGVGRNIDEIIRILDALAVVYEKKVATPANWKAGESALMPPPNTSSDAEKRTAKYKDDPNYQDWYLCKTKI